MSSDDIQKAKMHAIFMQRKYGSQDASSNASDDNKISKLSESETNGDEKSAPEELVDSKSSLSESIPSLTCEGSTSLAKLEHLSTNVSAPSLVESTDIKPRISGSLPSSIHSKPLNSARMVNSRSTKLTGQPSLEKPRRDPMIWRTPKGTFILFFHYLNCHY